MLWPKYNVYLDMETGNCYSLLFQTFIITMLSNCLASIYTVSEFLLNGKGAPLDIWGHAAQAQGPLNYCVKKVITSHCMLV